MEKAHFLDLHHTLLLCACEDITLNFGFERFVLRYAPSLLQRITHIFFIAERVIL